MEIAFHLNHRPLTNLPEPTKTIQVMFSRFPNIIIVAWIFLATTAACHQGHAGDEKSFNVLQIKDN
jgi:hypothetical protein